jgi:hypothetical protein
MMELDAVEITRAAQLEVVANTSDVVVVTVGVDEVATVAGRPEGAEALALSAAKSRTAVSKMQNARSERTIRLRSEFAFMFFSVIIAPIIYASSLSTP